MNEVMPEHRTLLVRNPRTGARDYELRVHDASDVSATAARVASGQAVWADAGVAHRRAVLAALFGGQAAPPSSEHGAISLYFLASAFAVLAVPATLMGATLPLLARHFVQEEQREGAAASQVGVLYALNTIGAVAGTILATKGLLPGLMRSPAADIVTIVSTSGWPGWDIGASSPFHAAKHGQSGFSDALRHELKGKGIRVMAVYPPDFDDVDPLRPDWDRKDRRLSNREVVDTVLFAVAAPRSCAYPVIILDHAQARSA